MSHVNTIQYIASFNDGIFFLIVTTYGGMDLGKWENSGFYCSLIKIDSLFLLDYSKNIFNQIMRAVNYLYEKGLAHGDLGFGNILLNKEGQVSLADFGQTSKMTREKEATECLALGRILYRMQTGKEYVSTGRRALASQFDSLESSSDLLDLIKALLEKTLSTLNGIMEHR
jgi:serine/threonine protein kinase